MLVYCKDNRLSDLATMLIYAYGYRQYLLPLVPHGTLRFSPSSQPGSPKILPTILHADELKRDAVVEAFKVWAQSQFDD